MILCYDTRELGAAIHTLAKPLCLVPTMGALHAGHLALMREARNQVGPNGTVAVSIFVNPMQFDRKEDLDKYPRPIDNDLTACQGEGVNLVFLPTPSAVYARDHSIVIQEEHLSRHLCGAARPGHFAGVCTVVMKLFQLFQCDSAVFGKKDFQQLAIIRRMVRDLNLPLKIIAHSTMREHDGLAMSSRNVRLSPEHRAEAPCIRKALLAARELARQGERRASKILTTAQEEIAKSIFLKVDYLSLVDAENLEPVDHVVQPALLAFAGFYGAVRLIDHVEIDP